MFDLGHCPVGVIVRRVCAWLSLPGALLGCLLLVQFAQESRAAETIRYRLFTADRHAAGEQVVERKDDGLFEVRFVFKDNGRGPELEERFRLAPDGTLAEYHVAGKAEMGGPIDEQFVREGARARWRSAAESGEADSAAGAFYVPRDSSWAVASVSIAAAAARADGVLPLLPTGTLTQRKLDEVEVVRSEPASAPQRQRVQLLEQVGLDFTPWYFWATTEATPRLFAVVIPGWQLAIEEGWEANLDTLAERQRTAAAVRHGELARKLAQPLPGLTVVRNARIFDSVAARVGPPSDVYVLRGQITAVRPAGSVVSGAQREIDAAGRVMLPGLFDMHGHVGRPAGLLHFAAGVTTVRDLGSDNAMLQRITDEALAGELLWPHIVPSGFLEGVSPFSSRLGIKITTLEEAKAGVDWYAARGYRQLKIYNSFPRQFVRETVAYAHARGLRVSGHVPAFMRAAEVVEQGFDELQHINQVVLNFLVTPRTDTRTLERFVLPAERLAALDLDSAPVREFITLLKRRRTVVDPTLATFDFLKQRDGQKSAPYAAVFDHLPPVVQRWMISGGMKVADDATAARYAASYEKAVQFVGRLYRAGVPLVAGTDALPGFTLHSELELYVKAGLTPAQALQVATLNGARYTGTLDSRGSIQAGKLADLVLVDGDPTRDIGDLRRVALVITQGKLISPSAIYRALGVKPFVAEMAGLRPGETGPSR